MQMILSCQTALGVISRRYLRGVTRLHAGLFTCVWIGGLSANQCRIAEQDTLILFSSQEPAIHSNRSQVPSSA